MKNAAVLPIPRDDAVIVYGRMERKFNQRWSRKVLGNHSKKSTHMKSTTGLKSDFSRIYLGWEGFFGFS
nr:MAG: hypothetical protein DIU66_08445 [Bacillota bacterium]